MSILGRILDQKRAELPELRRRRLPPPPALRPVRLKRAAGDPLALLTEFKRRSPSAGVLSQAMPLARRVQAYESGGASLISILCDATFFGGEYEDLREAREHCQLPLLCKEFVIDEAQLDAARAFGADAVLLIVRCLEQDRLRALVEAATARDLVPLVEAHGEEEVRRAVDSGAPLIGINARDLDTLVLDIGRAERALELVPDAIVRLHLSGLKQPSDVARVAASRVDGALVGEALMRADDPAELLRSLVRAARPTQGPERANVDR